MVKTGKRTEKVLNFFILLQYSRMQSDACTKRDINTGNYILCKLPTRVITSVLTSIYGCVNEAAKWKPTLDIMMLPMLSLQLHVEINLTSLIISGKT